MLIVRHLDAFRASLDREGATRGAVILACQCKPCCPGPVDERFCIKWMQRGREQHFLKQRSVTLDEDAYLILNGSEGSSSVYRGETGVRAFAVFFASDMVRQSLRADTFDQDSTGDSCRRDLGALEHLRPHGDSVSLILHQLARRVASGDDDDELWFEEKAVALLDSALALERDLRSASSAIASVKPATRHELLRRVLLAADFIWSNYEQPITLDDIADAARLSRFHLVRHFHQVQGVTPHAYLLTKRLAVAERLLLHTQLDLTDIAERAGFGTRWSLFRHLRKRLGAGGVALRHRVGSETRTTSTASPRALTTCHTSA